MEKELSYLLFNELKYFYDAKNGWDYNSIYYRVTEYLIKKDYIVQIFNLNKLDDIIKFIEEIFNQSNIEIFKGVLRERGLIISDEESIKALNDASEYITNILKLRKEGNINRLISKYIEKNNLSYDYLNLNNIYENYLSYREKFGYIMALQIIRNDNKKSMLETRLIIKSAILNAYNNNTIDKKIKDSLINELNNDFINEKDIYMKLLDAKDNKEIYKIIENSTFDITYLKSSLYLYIKDPEKIKKLEDILNKNYMEVFRKIYNIKHSTRRKTTANNDETYLNIRKSNPLLSKENDNVFVLWRNNEEQKEVLEYIYNLYIKNGYVKCAHLISDTFSIKLSKCHYLLSLAAVNAAKHHICSYTDSDIMLLDLENNKKSFYEVYDLLLKAEKEDEIYTIIYDSCLDYHYLKQCLHEYTLKKEDRITTRKILEDKLKIYESIIDKKNQDRKAKLKETKIKDSTITATKIVTKFIDSNYKTITEFCEKEKIKLSTFQNYVELLKEKNLNLYSIYVLKVSEESKKRYRYLITNAKNIISMIINGVELDDRTTRPYTIIDYFKSTSLTFDEIFNLLKKELNIQEVRAFRDFSNKYRNIKTWDSKNIKNYYNSNIIIGIKFDERNRPIPNTGHNITDEEKTEILDYLRNNNIPICQATINIIQKEIIENNILNKNKQK